MLSHTHTHRTHTKACVSIRLWLSVLYYHLSVFPCGIILYHTCDETLARLTQMGCISLHVNLVILMEMAFLQEPYKEHAVADCVK